MTTPAAGSPARAGNTPPRNGHGRYIRAIQTIDRDRRAAELVTQGWTYEQAAKELGYSDRGDTWRAVQKIRQEAARLDGTSEEIRRQQLAELTELRRRIWDQLNNPLPAIDRLGRIVLDGNGNPVPDAQALTAAGTLLVRVNERIARIRGTDAPRRAITLTGHTGPEEIRAFIASANPQDLAAAIEMVRRETEEAERTAATHDNPKAITATVEP